MQAQKASLGEMWGRGWPREAGCSQELGLPRKNASKAQVVRMPQTLQDKGSGHLSSAGTGWSCLPPNSLPWPGSLSRDRHSGMLRILLPNQSLGKGGGAQTHCQDDVAPRDGPWAGHQSPQHCPNDSSVPEPGISPVPLPGLSAALPLTIPTGIGQDAGTTIPWTLPGRAGLGEPQSGQDLLCLVPGYLISE